MDLPPSASVTKCIFRPPSASAEHDITSHEPGQVDLEAIKGAVRTILQAVGENPDRPGLLDTPRRVAKMYAEMFDGLHKDPARHLKVTFPEQYDELVLVRDTPFTSMCEVFRQPSCG